MSEAGVTYLVLREVRGDVVRVLWVPMRKADTEEWDIMKMVPDIQPVSSLVDEEEEAPA